MYRLLKDRIFSGKTGERKQKGRIILKDRKIKMSNENIINTVSGNICFMYVVIIKNALGFFNCIITDFDS